MKKTFTFCGSTCSVISGSGTLFTRISKLKPSNNIFVQTVFNHKFYLKDCINERNLKLYFIYFNKFDLIMSEYIFDESLISTEIQDALSPKLKLRPLAKDDFNKGLYYPSRVFE